MATDSNARENLHPVVDSTSGQSSVVEENCRSSEYFSDNFNILDHSDLNSILDPDNGIEWRNADEELPEISDNELHNKFLLDPKSFDSIKLRTVEHISNKESKTGTELVTEGNSQPAVVQDFFIREYKCAYPSCDVKMKKRSEYTKHIKMHGKPFFYQCKLPGCGKIFSCSSTFSAHKAIHQPKVRCENCGDLFTRFQTLKKHKEVYCRTPRLIKEDSKSEQIAVNRRKDDVPNLQLSVVQDSFIKDGQKYRCGFSGCNVSIQETAEYIKHIKKHNKPGVNRCNCVFVNIYDGGVAIQNQLT
ncbi:Uncharacterized protein BM_BM10437 [Brugia malayi]|uniref:Bm10437 n=1 Tax=Brugia malayi TaxID=6279 RepID=A0A0J9XZ32_BRUMA|nr:Uncharacterized protein BM_BM10437 [Brugia malayi]CDP98147.1 Bm10437 [Brugia malayi]VIO93907.1 Uncharacterized protein BM_BM10437 [Brugia malayi]